MGEINTKDYLIDYLSITVHLPLANCVNLYNHHFSDALFGLIDQDHGAKGFKGVKEAAMGFQLKHSPGHGRDYCSFMFPGNACRAIPPEFFTYFYRTLKKQNIEFRVTRLDFAYDCVPFTPKMFFKIIEEDKYREKIGEKRLVRTLTQRDTVQLITQPFLEREDKSGLGRDTCYFGSRQSERYLRVYNMRGPTRLEIEYKGKRAERAAKDILSKNEEEWLEISIGHLLDFIDIDIDWWKEFKGDSERAYAKIYSAKEKSLENISGWLLDQVSPSLAAVTECTGGQILSDMLDEGAKRMHKNHKNLLSQYGK